MKKLFENAPISEAFAGIYLSIFSSSMLNNLAGDGIARTVYISLSFALVGVAFCFSIKRSLNESDPKWPYVLKSMLFYAGGVVLAGWSGLTVAPLVILGFTLLYLTTYVRGAAGGPNENSRHPVES